VATFIQLPDQKTSQNNLATWMPGLPGQPGLLTIHMERGSTRYTVAEFPTPWHGRAFRMSKDTDSYDVFVGLNGQDHQCSCAAHAYGRGRACKHVLACRAIIASELVNPEADRANTEPNDQPAPKPVSKPRDWSRIEAEFA
jgi:hypothetical protein